MAQLPKSLLKAYFETGDKPTQEQFYSLVDSYLNFVNEKKYLGFKIYNTTIGYAPGDITIYNGSAYQAIAITSGTFDPSKWEALDFNTDATVISILYDDLVSLAAADDLQTGHVYFITDKGIWIQALTTNKLSLEGKFLAVNPDYQNTGGNNVGLWSAEFTDLVANTSIAIWNSLHWLNLTGDTGSNTPDLDPDNWELLSPETDPTYVQEIDDIKYNFELDFIFERSDKRGNFICSLNDADGRFGLRPMEFFQWGRDGVNGNFIKNSLLRNDNSYTIISNVRATDFSIVFNLGNANCSNAVFSNALVAIISISNLQNSIVRNILILALVIEIENPAKRIVPGYSDFEIARDVTDQTTLILNALSYAGIVNVTSANSEESLDNCSAAPTKHPFEIRPSPDLILNIINGSGASGEFGLSMPVLTLDGSKGDFAKFRVDEDDDVVRVIEWMNYA
jgi:hypothetical protein